MSQAEAIRSVLGHELPYDAPANDVVEFLRKKRGVNINIQNVYQVRNFDKKHATAKKVKQQTRIQASQETRKANVKPLREYVLDALYSEVRLTDEDLCRAAAAAGYKTLASNYLANMQQLLYAMQDKKLISKEKNPHSRHPLWSLTARQRREMDEQRGAPEASAAPVRRAARQAAPAQPALPLDLQTLVEVNDFAAKVGGVEKLTAYANLITQLRNTPVHPA
jgi:hypothetical protein